MTTPTFVAAGTVGANSVTPRVPLPTGYQAGDFLLLMLGSSNEALTAPTGWTEISDDALMGTGAANTALSVRLGLFWKYAQGDNESEPFIVDAGGNTYGVILAFRGVNPNAGLAVNVTATGNALTPTSTTVTVPGATTTVDNCLVVAVCARGTDLATAQFSGWTNADLASLTEVFDLGTTTGNGGGFGVATGVKVAAGAYGNTTATLATTALQGRVSFALRGVDDALDERAMFCYPNFADDSETVTPSLSGGSWNASFPLNNLKTELLSEVARSSTDANADTQFEANLGVTREVRFVGLYGHNISLDGRVRVRASSVAGSFGTPLYDSGWVDAYPEIYPPDTLQPGHPSYSDRLMTLEDWSEPDNRIPFQLVLPNIVGARYWLVEVDDTTNPDGYVEIGRLFISWAYQAGINFAGADLGWVTSTTVVEMDGGGDFFDDRGVRREFRFRWGNVDADEALTFMYDELLRKHGIVKQLVFIYNPTDTYHLHRRSMLCRHKETNPLTVPLADYHDTVVTLREARG